MQRPIVTRVCGVVAFGLVSLAVAAAQATYISTITAANPAGYWRLSESSGTTAANQISGGAAGSYTNFSSSGYGKTGALTASGDYNAAAGFVATEGTYVAIPESVVGTVGTGAFSVEMWINATQTSSRADLMDYYGGSGSKDMGLLVEGNQLRFCAMSTSAWRLGSHTLSAGNWYHVALTRDTASNIVAYVNGQQDFSISGSTENFGAMGNAIRIGNNVTSANPIGFTGSIDELAIYTRALSQSEALAHYNAGVTAVPEPLSVVLLGTGLVGLLAYAWRKRK